MNGFWDHKTVLVTGGRGFLGTAVVRQLNSVGTARVIASSTSDCDLTQPDQTEKFIEQTHPDLVIHLAARVGGIGANMARPADLYLENLLMGTYVLDACLRLEVEKTVMIGTICSYPKFTPVPFKESSLWQGYPEETNAPYGIAKLAQLVQLQANREQFGQNAIYLMPTNLYGPGDKFHPDVSHVIPALIRKCVNAKDAGDAYIDVWGTGSASREFLYVDDAARAIVLACEHYDGGEPVNLGTHQELPISDLVHLIADAVGFEGEIRWDATKPDGQPRRCTDPSRAKELFGFEATTSFDTGIAETVTWYRAHREAAEAKQR